MNEFDYADRYLIDYKTRGNEIVAKYCPFCNGGSHKDKHTFYLNYDRHTYMCHRGSCGAKGTFNQLAQEKGEKTDYMQTYESRIKVKKTYTPPSMKLETVTDKAIAYIKSRGISEETIKHFDIKSDEKGNIVFPYRNEQGILELNKIRIPRKFVKGKDSTKIWQEGNGRPILFGMDLIRDTDTIVLTEGEWDCLSVYESGFKNVVSIPFGTENFEWVNECWEWLQQFKTIIIFFDNDEAGVKASNQAIAKLGEARVLIVRLDARKDANELMWACGKGAVMDAIGNAEKIALKDFVRMADVEDRERDGELFGIKMLDYRLGGCVYGDLNIWTGKRGGAKSTILSQTAIDCVEQDKRLFWYSGELSNSRVRQWLETQMCAGQMLEEVPNKITGFIEKRVPTEVSKVLRKWYENNLFVFGDMGGHNEDDLFQVMTYAYMRYDVRRFILDNMKTVRFATKTTNKYEQQASFIARCKDFCNKYNVHIDLVVHPRKSNSEEMTDEDVGGTSDIIDLADNVIECGKIAYDKVDKFDKTASDRFGIDVTIKDKYMNYLHIIKNREYGNTGYKVLYRFNKDARRIEEAVPKKLTYGYIEQLEKIGKFEQQEINMDDMPF